MTDVDQQILGSLFLTLKSGDQWKSIVGLFDSGWKSRISAIEESTRIGNFSEAKSAAHALKGSCYMFGARQCAKKCEELETHLASGDFTDVPALIADLKVNVKNFRRYLDDELSDRNLLT
jgi:HPt (histidine-containing phosphotransfer) domain-containing protein